MSNIVVSIVRADGLAPSEDQFQVISTCRLIGPTQCSFYWVITAQPDKRDKSMG